MTGFEDEAVVTLQRPPERIEDAARHFDDAAARLADEVLMDVLGEVIDGGTVAQVYVVDDAEFLEVVEKAVHR